jgi:hypothetical protein
LASRLKEDDDDEFDDEEDEKKRMKRWKKMWKKTSTINLDFFPLRGWLKFKSFFTLIYFMEPK